MDRRSFLRGTFGGVTASGLVLAGSLNDIELFASDTKPGEALVISPVPGVMDPPIPAAIGYSGDIGMLVFNHKGEPLGVIDRVDVCRSHIETTMAGDMFKSYTNSGPSRIKFTVTGYGPAAFRVLNG